MKYQTNSNNQKQIIMKKIVYLVEVEFEDHINSDNEINEVGHNILNGLNGTVNNEGLSPNDSETFTKSLTVSNSITKDTLTKKYL